jgi:hypothetical protein
MRIFPLTTTLAPLYYFDTNQYSYVVARGRQESAEEAYRISGVKRLSKRIKELKVR